MSILIKGMEMPKCCAECEWHEYYGGDYDWVHACRRTGTMPIENAETERANDCPIIEVPTPHGRLIDADFEEHHYTSMTTNPTPDVTEQDKHNSLVIVRALQMAKTIIEAEE